MCVRVNNLSGFGQVVWMCNTNIMQLKTALVLTNFKLPKLKVYLFLMFLKSESNQNRKLNIGKVRYVFLFQCHTKSSIVWVFAYTCIFI